MLNIESKQARDNVATLFVIAALGVILAGFFFRQLQALLPAAAFILILCIFINSRDANIRYLSGVLTLYFGASTLSNICWYFVPQIIDLEFVQSANYYYATGMFWLAGYAAVAYVLLHMKNSRQWYIDHGLDRLITAIAVVGFFLVTLLVFLNLRLDSPNIVDILLLLIYLCFDAIILMLTLKLLYMNLKRELKALVYAVLLFFSINTLGDLLFECRWLFGLGSLMSFNIVGLGWTLTVRNTTDLIYEVSLMLMIGCLLLYLIDPFRNCALDDARRRLKDTQLFVDDLVAKSPDATCIFGHDGRLLLANDAFLHIFGLDRKNVSSTYNVFNHMSRASQQYPLYGQIDKVREGETVIIPKIKINRIEGGRQEPFYIYLKMFPTFDTKGQISNYVLIIEDITDRVRLEDDLLEAYSSLKEEYERKTDFTNAAAHELRTPLTPIIGYTDILMSEINDERHLKYLEIIERNAIRQKNMVNRMLELASLDAGMAHVNRSEFPVLPLVNEVADNYRTVNPDILVDVPEGLRITSDADVIRHVLDNLVSNAVKYSINGGQIEIGAVEDGDHYRFSVKDQGAGIQKEEWDRIFERFYIVGGDRDNRTSGRVGLGLALVKAYVNLIGGTVWVESEPGKGSTFFFIVPKVAQPAGQAANV
jgi:PAS domain S-box-containing protein